MCQYTKIYDVPLKLCILTIHCFTCMNTYKIHMGSVSLFERYAGELSQTIADYHVCWHRIPFQNLLDMYVSKLAHTLAELHVRL